MCKNEFIVYNDLISKGLIVKDGMHYGATFSVYEGDPNECHSYCLVYTCHGEEDLLIKSMVKWTRISAFNNKKSIIAFVNCVDKTVRYASLERLRL